LSDTNVYEPQIPALRLQVLGEGYSLDDDEDMTVQTVTDLWIYQGR